MFIEKDDSQVNVTQLLKKVQGGDQPAFDHLLELVYEELKRVAQGQMRREREGHTLDTTGLVHEAYLKLVDQNQAEWQDRAHFFGVAARAMRQILIDYARTKRAQKRGGNRVRVTLDELRLAPPGSDSADRQAELLIVLDESLERLAGENERQSRIVECRFFGGMTVPDTAVALGVSRATVKRGWAMAKAWLYRDMQQGLAG